jgi:hypothetical protein
LNGSILFFPLLIALMGILGLGLGMFISSLVTKYRDFSYLIGFGVQLFIENTYSKVKKLKELITRKGANTIIEIDGGVTNKNAKQLVEAGADVLVAGSFVFNAENPIQTVADLKKLTCF